MDNLIDLAKKIFNEDLAKDKITPYQATRQQMWNEAVDRAQEQWDNQRKPHKAVMTTPKNRIKKQIK